MKKYQPLLFATLLLLTSGLSTQTAYAQGEQLEEKSKINYSYKPLTLNLSDDGLAYIRFIIWNQLWLQTNNLSGDENLRITPQIRRARILAFAQISPRFLVLSHFGMNSESPAGLDPLGENTNVSLFFHGVWGEYKLFDNHYAGLGLHYWNGLSRLTSQSTLNFMTLDAPIFNWAQLGLSDQFARHLGAYAKGEVGKFHYRVSLNQSLQSSLDVTRRGSVAEGAARYGGRFTTDSLRRANSELEVDNNAFVAQGYFNYNFLDMESHKLPYFVGTYLGTKKIFNVGFGFFHHQGGTVTGTTENDFEFYNVNHFAIDAFYDAPIGNNGSAVNALLAYYNYDFGPNYVKTAANPARSIATGNLFYAQLGYLLPGEGTQDRFMPYVTYANGDAEAFDANSQIFKLGLNYFMNGHNSKLTLEYQNTQTPTGGEQTADADILTLQLHVFL
ncbi:porin [Tunicatimonas pelagia]|uniref:porin n=1 Tax=Tunicatimonas pelagia TaxID=931531 RepID=UPI002666E098|nr:porin [Tunicatimonas pelagia]WKN43033.1 porin [Tunicatimonas pelagia]